MKRGGTGTSKSETRGIRLTDKKQSNVLDLFLRLIEAASDEVIPVPVHVMTVDVQQ